AHRAPEAGTHIKRGVLGKGRRCFLAIADCPRRPSVDDDRATATRAASAPARPDSLDTDHARLSGPTGGERRIGSSTSLHLPSMNDGDISVHARDTQGER